MDTLEIKDGILRAFQKVLGHNNFELEDETTAHDIDGWESITHMMIITEIENIFDIKFKLMDLMNMNNVGDLTRVAKQEINGS